MKSYAPLMSIVALATVALPVGASAADSLPLPKSVVIDLVRLRCSALSDRARAAGPRGAGK